MNLKSFCLTAAVATLSLNATWVHAEEDDANEFETNTVNSQSSTCDGHVIQVSTYPQGSPSYTVSR